MKYHHLNSRHHQMLTTIKEFSISANTANPVKAEIAPVLGLYSELPLLCLELVVLQESLYMPKMGFVIPK